MSDNLIYFPLEKACPYCHMQVAGGADHRDVIRNYLCCNAHITALFSISFTSCENVLGTRTLLCLSLVHIARDLSPKHLGSMGESLPFNQQPLKLSHKKSLKEN